MPDVCDQITMERQDLVNAKFPNLVSTYFETVKREKEKKQSAKKKSKSMQFDCEFVPVYSVALKSKVNETEKYTFSKAKLQRT